MTHEERRALSAKLRKQAIEMCRSDHSMGYIVEQLRISPSTVQNYVLSEQFPNLMLNASEAQEAYNAMQAEGTTAFQQ